MKREDKISEIVTKIKLYYKPDLIILFGSWGRGDYSEDSDLDLLVVKNTKRRPIWRRVDVRKIVNTDIPMDVVVYTPQEFKNLRQSSSAFLKDVLREGQIIYEKK